MSLLGVSQLRFLTRTPWSTLTVLLGVTLGVASVVAVHLISLRVTEFLDSATPPHLAGLTHLLERDSGTTTAEDYFALRERWRRGEVPGVRGLLPIVEGQALIAGQRAVVFAVDWLAAGGFPAEAVPMILPAGGGSSALDGLVVDSSLGLAADDVVRVAGQPFTVAGVAETRIGPAVFADIGVGQALLGVDPQRLSYVGALRLAPLRRLKDAIEAMLPGMSAGFDGPADSWRVDGWRVRRVESELPTLGFARSVIFNLGALGSLALVVAWFLIYQVGVIWHRRRRRLTDRLRAMGVTRRELTFGFVAGFAVLGLLATLLGLFAGMLLAQVLSGISTAGLEAPGVLPGLTPWVVAKAAFSGIGISCLGGWMACRREWPADETARPAPGVGPWLGPTLLVLILAAGVWAPDTGLLGGFAAVLAVSLLVVVCVRPLLEHLRRMSVRLPGRLLTRIGLREITWYPRDLSIAVGALSLAVATSMGVGLMVDSFRTDFAAMLDQRLSHDLFVDGGGRDLSGVREWLAGQPDVAHVQAYGRSRERLLGGPVELGFTGFSAAESARYGLSRALGPDEVMVSERLAGAAELRIGDAMEVRGRLLRVAAVFRGFGEAGYRMLVDDETARRLGVAGFPDRLSVTTVGGDPAQRDAQLAERLLTRFADAIPGLQARPRGSVRAAALDIFDRTFAITTALTLLALLVAVIGMYNALLALRLNQAPGYRLLGALGVGAAERRGIALRRSAAVGCLAVALALPLGIAMAWLLCHVINPRAFGWSLNLQFSAGEMLLPASLGLLAALLAGLLPIPGEHEAGYEEA